MSPPRVLLCTVGTSLFRPNLDGLARRSQDGQLPDALRPLAEAHAARDPAAVARHLAALAPTDHLCGAEINSVASLLDKGYAAADCGLFFFHSATDDGRAIAAVLTAYFRGRGHAPVEAVEVADLQDADARRFRTLGLRHLARELCRVIRDHSAAACAIDATGGYKAQIAIAVLLGQALGVPVYYKHELFHEIIAFPPLPVAFDFEVWMRASGLLFDLEHNHDLVPAAGYTDDWDERYESLIERVAIDGREYLALSPTGQIFHETFRGRFNSVRDQVLPPPVPAGGKKAPLLKSNEGHMLAHREPIQRFLTKVTEQVPQVAVCMTTYYNPDLPAPTRFHLSSRGIEGVYSDGTYSVKFRVETSAQTPGQQAAVVAALNQWLAGQKQP
jgi:putative CRISPR-associated protein (TIGR02619 family)